MKQDSEIISSGTPHEVHMPEGGNNAVLKTASAMEPQIRTTIADPDAPVELIEIVAGVSKSDVQEDTVEHHAAPTEQPAAPDRMVHEEAAELPDRLVQADAAEASDHQVQVDVADTSDRLVQADVAEASDRQVQVDVSEQPDHFVQDSASQAPDQLVSDDAPAADPGTPVQAQPLTAVMSELPSLDLDVHDAAPETTPSPADAPQEAPAQADTSGTPDDVATPGNMEEMNFPARVVKLKIANDQIRGQIEKLEKPLFPPMAVEAPAPAKGKDKEPAKKPAKGH